MARRLVIRPTTVTTMFENLYQCSNCKLCHEADEVGIRGRGSDRPILMLVGEAPGKSENREGSSFVGASGQILDDMCADAGLEEDDYRYENIVRCIPWDDDFSSVRRPEEGEIQACSPYFLADLDYYKPEVIVSVGATATKYLTGKGQITKVAGNVLRSRVPRYRWVDDEHTETEKVEGEFLDITVVPTIHPATILYGGFRDEPKKSPNYHKISNCIRTAATLAKGGDEEEEMDFRFIDSLEELEELVDDLIRKYKRREIDCVSVDIETSISKKFDPDGYIWSIQFAWSPTEARCLLVEHPNSPFNNFHDWPLMAKQIRRILKKIPVAGQRFQYDYVWLYYYFGVKCRVKYDTLFMHHCLFSGESANDLDYMSGRYLKRGSFKWRMHQELRERKLTNGEMHEVPLDVFLSYACNDACAVIELIPILKKKLKKRTRPDGKTLYDTYDMLYRKPFEAIMAITLNGVRVHKDRYERLLKEYPEQIEEIRKRVTQSPFYDVWQEETKTEAKGYWVRTKRIVNWSVGCRCGKKYLLSELPTSSVKGHLRFSTGKGNEKQKNLFSDKVKPKYTMLDKPKMGAQHRCFNCGTWNTLNPIRIEPKVLKTETVIDKNGKEKEKIVEVKPVVNPYVERWEYKDFNPNSSDQVGKLLDLMKLPFDAEPTVEDDDEEDDEDDDSGDSWGNEEPSSRTTGKKVMRNLVVWCNNNNLQEHKRVLESIIEVRKVSKLYGSYVKKLPKIIPVMDDPVKNDRPCRLTQLQSEAWLLRAYFNLSGTRTGRLSSSDPSLQQMPFKSLVKWMYVSRWYEEGGLLLCCDYSQMELRVLAMLTQDPYLREAFIRGEDVHRAVASLVYDKPISEITILERKYCKTINFGIVYGKGVRSLAYDLGISEKKAQKLLDLYWSKMPILRDWIEKLYDELEDDGESWTPTGRCRPIPEIFDRKLTKGQRNRARRKKVNTPIQGGASDLCLLSAVEIYEQTKKQGLKSLQFDQVHDSIDYDVHPGELVTMLRLNKKTMESHPAEVFDWVDVPVAGDAEIGVDWQRQMSISDLGKDERGNDLLKISGSPDYWPEIKEQIRKSYKVKELEYQEGIVDDQPHVTVTLAVRLRENAA